MASRRPGRLFGPPRAPSSIGIITIALLLALFIQWPPSRFGLILGLAAFLSSLFTLQYLFDNSPRPLTPTFIALVIMDSVPYLIGMGFYGLRVLIYMVPSVIMFSVYIALAVRKKGRETLALVLGSTALATFFFGFSALMNTLSPLAVSVGFLFLIYNLAEVLFVESRLSFRKVGGYVPLLALAPALLVLLFYPWYFIIPIIEPFIKALRRLNGGDKVTGYERVSRLGRSEAIRYIIFFILLLMVIVAYKYGFHL